MSVLEAIVLAIVQGITEFLPISSSGHLVLTPWLFGWEDQGLAFDAAVHVGTLGAVLVYFRREWLGLAGGLARNDLVPFGNPGEGAVRAWRLVALLVVGSIPAAVVGLLIKDAVEGPLREPEWVALFLIGTAVLLVVAERLGRPRRPAAAASNADAIKVGFAQALAILPGISRSGATITAGVLAGFTREAAARLSFFLAAPAILGAGLLLLVDVWRDDEPTRAGAGDVAIGVVVSFVTALLALAWLMRLLRTGSLMPFAGYTAAVGVAVIVARLAGA